LFAPKILVKHGHIPTRVLEKYIEVGSDGSAGRSIEKQNILMVPGDINCKIRHHPNRIKGPTSF
jgi:hypothetical protein